MRDWKTDFVFYFFILYFYLFLCSGFQERVGHRSVREGVHHAPSPPALRLPFLHPKLYPRKTPARNLMLLIFPGQNIKLLWGSLPSPFLFIPIFPSLTHIHTHSLSLSLSGFFSFFIHPVPSRSGYPSPSYSFSPFLNSFLPPSLPFFLASSSSLLLFPSPLSLLTPPSFSSPHSTLKFYFLPVFPRQSHLS